MIYAKFKRRYFTALGSMKYGIARFKKGYFVDLDP
jgi:hypothetical protein